jgi:hypothetical protein
VMIPLRRVWQLNSVCRVKDVLYGLRNASRPELQSLVPNLWRRTRKGVRVNTEILARVPAEEPHETSRS